MHPKAFDYVVKAADLTGIKQHPLKAVEFGACDVNGNAREIFPNARWVGVDRRKGPNVNVVVNAEHWVGPPAYDLVLTTEMLEHAPNPRAVLESAWNCLRPGGLLIATMAAPERRPHSNDGDNNHIPDGEHYEGISEEAIRSMLLLWEIIEVVHDPAAGDLYVTARRPR